MHLFPATPNNARPVDELSVHASVKSPLVALSEKPRNVSTCQTSHATKSSERKRIGILEAYGPRKSQQHSTIGVGYTMKP